MKELERRWTRLYDCVSTKGLDELYRPFLLRGSSLTESPLLQAPMLFIVHPSLHGTGHRTEEGKVEEFCEFGAYVSAGGRTLHGRASACSPKMLTELGQCHHIGPEPMRGQNGGE